MHYTKDLTWLSQETLRKTPLLFFKHQNRNIAAHLLSEVTVSYLWMCHVGVVGHRIHLSLCALTEVTIQRHWLSVEWLAKYHSLSLEMTEERKTRAGGRGCALCSCLFTRSCAYNACRCALTLLHRNVYLTQRQVFRKY